MGENKSKKYETNSLPKFQRFKSLDEFTILEEIGKGGYSKVYLVSNKKQEENMH